MPIRVRYAETDQMGQVYHANYLVWFEAGRGHVMRELGLPYGRLEEAGFLLPVTRFDALMRIPAVYDDELRVRTWVELARSRAVHFRYHVVRGHEILAEGSTLHVSMDRKGRAVRMPVAATELLTAYAARWPAPPARRPKPGHDPS